MQTIQQFLFDIKCELMGVTETPQLEAEILLAHVLQKPRSYLFTFPEKILDQATLQQAKGFIHRRTLGEPIAYILESKEFWSLSFQVTPATLIPRPETELLVETTLALLNPSQATLADLGTGCGTIALSLAHERPTWQIYATDISQEALTIARKNAQQFKLNNVSFYEGNWCTALPCTNLDAIISNPPYIAETEWDNYVSQLKSEPHQALVSGKDGMLAINEIIRSAAFFLRPGGYLLIEHGFLQGNQVKQQFAQNNYHVIHSINDFSGHPRVTVGQLIST